MLAHQIETEPPALVVTVASPSGAGHGYHDRSTGPLEPLGRRERRRAGAETRRAADGENQESAADGGHDDLIGAFRGPVNRKVTWREPRPRRRARRQRPRAGSPRAAAAPARRPLPGFGSGRTAPDAEPSGSPGAGRTRPAPRGPRARATPTAGTTLRARRARSAARWRAAT